MPEFDFITLKKSESQTEIKTPQLKAKKPPKKKVSSQTPKLNITQRDILQEIKLLKKEVDALKQEKTQKEELFIPSLHDVNVCYKALCRVIRQLSGSRSSDYKKEAIIVKKKIETHLIKKGVI